MRSTHQLDEASIRCAECSRSLRDTGSSQNWSGGGRSECTPSECQQRQRVSVLTIFVVGDALEPGRFCERAPFIQRKAVFREQQIVDVPANPTRPDESKPAHRTFRERTRNGFSTANAVSRVRYSAQKHAMRPQHPSTFRNNRKI